MHYGFEYIGREDLARVMTNELLDGEVLERIQEVLASVSVIPYQYPERDHEHPPATISILTCVFLKCLDIVDSDSYKLMTVDAAFGAKFQ